MLSDRHRLEHLSFLVDNARDVGRMGMPAKAQSVHTPDLDIQNCYGTVCLQQGSLCFLCRNLRVLFGEPCGREVVDDAIRFWVVTSEDTVEVRADIPGISK